MANSLGSSSRPVCTVCAGSEQPRAPAGCAQNPLYISLSAVHIRSGNPLRELAKIGFENKVCIGFESVRHDLEPVSLDFDHVSLRELLNELFPGFTLEVTDSVVNLKQNESRNPPSWLDYKISSF